MDKTGHWILDSIVSMDNTNIKTFIYKCSECGFYTTSNRIDVCRHCGAKMNNQEKGKNRTEGRVMEELKPCPFCNDTYIRVHYIKGGNYVVGCNTLNCICLHSDGKLFNSAEKAVEAWNRRASDDKTD